MNVHFSNGDDNDKSVDVLFCKYHIFVLLISFFFEFFIFVELIQPVNTALLLT